MPTLRQRAGVALKAVAGLFSESSSRQAYGMLAGIYPAGVGEAPTRGARERVAAFADVPWLHAIADKVAYQFASVQWTLGYQKKVGDERATRAKAVQRMWGAQRAAALKAMRQRGELREVEDHPLLDALDGGNAMMTGLAARHLTCLYWDLEGEAFWMLERNKINVPVAIWPLPPDWVRELPVPGRPAFRMSFRGWQGLVPETEVLWLPKHNPSNPYGRGTGLARALADEIEVDEYAAKTVRQSFFNQARPDYIVSPAGTQTLTPVQVERLEQDWTAEHEGFWRAFRPRFATRELKIHEFQQTDFRRLQMIQIREDERNLIRNCWGVPPEVMGIVEPGASRATINRADFMMAKYVVVPRLEMMRALLQERFAPLYDERLILDYVSPIEEDNEYALSVRRTAPWAWSVDEWREMAGSEPLEGDKGKYYLVPGSVSPREDFEPQEPPPGLFPPGLPLPGEEPEDGEAPGTPPALPADTEERRVFLRSFGVVEPADFRRPLRPRALAAPRRKGRRVHLRRGDDGLVASVTVEEIEEE